MNEEGSFVFGQNDVGANVSKGEVRRAKGDLIFARAHFGLLISHLAHGNPDVQTKAIAHPVEQGAHNEFGLGVLAADARHVPRAMFGAEAIF